MGIQIQAVTKCFFLRQIAEGAKTTTSNLADATVALQSLVCSPSFKTGKVVISQSGSGQSGSYLMPSGDNAWTPANIGGLCEELLMMIEAADPVLLPDDADPANTEALRKNIAANIMAGNVPDAVRSTGGDFTLLFLPVFGTGVNV